MSRRTQLLLFFFLLVKFGSGQNIVQFKISKPYCIFNFLETATTNKGTSATLRNYITENTKEDSVFKILCRNFKNIQFDYIYKRNEYPENRRPFRSTLDLLNIVLVNSDNWSDFKSKIVGILPNAELEKLISALKAAEKYYDKIIWDKYEGKLKNQLKALDAYSGKASVIFSRLVSFYNSNWPADIPFVVALYPIPGTQGNTTATPHANSLCVGVLTDETKYDTRISVVLHEMCHVLYDEQTKEFQHQLDRYFTSNSSPYSKFAYSFFDEGLATALGNGWSYKSLHGTLNPADWYNNRYINGYAKALYPFVDQYLEQNRKLDSFFVSKAINLFAQIFPNAISDYSILLNKVSIYSNESNAAGRNELVHTVRDYFQMASTNLSSPITDKQSLDLLKSNLQTQLIVIDRNHAETWKELKILFPQISKDVPANIGTAFNLSFFDDTHRAIIMLNVVQEDDLRNLLFRMKDMTGFNSNAALQK